MLAEPCFDPCDSPSLRIQLGASDQIRREAGGSGGAQPPRKIFFPSSARDAASGREFSSWSKTFGEISVKTFGAKSRSSQILAEKSRSKVLVKKKVKSLCRHFSSKFFLENLGKKNLGQNVSSKISAENLGKKSWSKIFG